MRIPQVLKDLGHEIKLRLMPFLMLLDSRYLPLILVESYQSFSVYLYLWNNSPKTSADFVFSVLGGAGFTAIYVGVIAWAERREYNGWVTVTAFTALVFGVSVAIVNFWPTQGVLAVLHAGFPLTGFAYTLAMHGAPAPRNPIPVVLGWVNSRSAAVNAIRQQMNALEVQLNEAREYARKAWTEKATFEEWKAGAIRAYQDLTSSYQGLATTTEQETRRADEWAERHEQVLKLAEQERRKNEQARRDIERLETASDIDKPAIARKLKAADTTVAEIARLLNVSTGTVSNWTKAVTVATNGHLQEA